jgi:hypothetical protein
MLSSSGTTALCPKFSPEELVSIEAKYDSQEHTATDKIKIPFYPTELMPCPKNAHIQLEPHNCSLKRVL